jgi:DNA polymerase-3 subunit delta'
MSFKDIQGQQRPIERISKYIALGRFQGSYLFTGPKGVGKKKTAVTIAKAINCLSYKAEETIDCCDKCPSCLKIENRQHPDIHITDTYPEEIKIEDIRQLQKDISLRPYEARKKIFIIDEAHNLNIEASNAFLKTLEEPTTDTIIILVSSKPNLLFKTIISRCQIIKFFALERKELEEILRNNYGLHSHLSHYLAYSCEGSLGESLKFKELPVLEEKNRIIDYFLSSEHEFEIKEKLNAPEIKNILNILVGWFRDVYLYKIGTKLEELINIDRKIELSHLSKKYTFEQLDSILNSISRGVAYLDYNINPKLLLANLRAEL